MRFEIATQGHYDFKNVTQRVQECVTTAGVTNGVAVCLTPGSTAGLTTMKWEKEAMDDLIALYEKMSSEDAPRAKSTMMGTSVTVPIKDGELDLGTWEAIVLVDFDDQSRTCEVVVEVMEK